MRSAVRNPDQTGRA